MRVRPFTLPVSAAVLCLVSLGHAEPRSVDEVRAQELFDEGMNLKQRARFADACPKFEESQRLDPGLGTQYHLADCYEKQGRTGSAWLLFDEIARQAAISKQKDRERIARERMAEVGPRVPRLVVAVPVTSDVAALEIARNGVNVPRERWNAPVPVDPGAHEIVARSRDRAWRTSVVLDARARTETVVVPSLAPVTVAAGTPSATATPIAGDERSRGAAAPNTRRVLGIGALAAGGLGLGAGAVFTALAVTSYDRARDLGCGTSTCPTRAGVEERSAAVDSGNMATAAFAVGAVATGIGLYLVLSGPREPSKPVITAAVGANGVRLGGTF